MKMLSTGQPSTLGSYRDIVSLLGVTKAKEYFDKKIAEAENGEDEEVLAEESQMIQLIVNMLE